MFLSLLPKPDLTFPGQIFPGCVTLNPNSIQEADIQGKCGQSLNRRVMRPFAVHRSKSGTRLEWDTIGVDERSWVCSLTFSASLCSITEFLNSNWHFASWRRDIYQVRSIVSILLNSLMILLILLRNKKGMHNWCLLNMDEPLNNYAGWKMQGQKKKKKERVNDPIYLKF